MRPTGRIHAADLSKSPRLQRALAALKRAGARGLTTREWQNRADICNPDTDAAELRSQGYDIPCVFEGRSPQGSSVFRYRLIPGAT